MAEKSGATEALKESGTQKYTGGDLFGALGDYLSALEAVESSVHKEEKSEANRKLRLVLRSNVSAVLYELGLYEEALAHSQRVLDSVSEEKELSQDLQGLREKNSKRVEKIQKMLTPGAATGVMSASLSRELVRRLPRYRPARLNQGLEVFIGHEAASSAFRLTRDEDAVESFLDSTTEGDGKVLSVNEARKLVVDIFDEKSDTKKGDDRTFSVFFGGCGDSRHFMLTIIDLMQQISRRGPDAQSAYTFNFVLNDIHPVLITRLLLIIKLSQDIVNSETTLADLQEASASPAKDSATCAQFLFASTLIPPRIYDDVFLPLVADAIAVAEGQLALASPSDSEPCWRASIYGISVDAQTLRAVLAKLRDWQAGVGSVSSKAARKGWLVDRAMPDAAIDQNHKRQVLEGDNPQVRQMREEKIEQEKADLTRHITSLSEEDFKAHFENPMFKTMITTLAAQESVAMDTYESMPLEEQKAFVLKVMLPLSAHKVDNQIDQEGPPELRILASTDNGRNCVACVCALERYFVWVKQYLLPPDVVVAVLGELEPAGAAARGEGEGVGRQLAVGSRWTETLLESGDSTDRFPKFTAFTQKCVQKCRDLWGPVKDWKTNPTIGEDSMIAEMLAANGPLPPYADPLQWKTMFDPITVGYDLYRAAELDAPAIEGVIQKPPKQTQLSDFFSYFFWAFGKGLQSLLGGVGNTEEREQKKAARVVLFCGDVNEAIEAACPLGSRESSKFDRIFLSNVPDYTAFLPVLTTCAAALKHHPLSEPSPSAKSTHATASIQSNVLMNTQLFSSYDAYLFNGAFVKLAHAEKPFGLKCTNDNLWTGLDNRWEIATPPPRNHTQIPRAPSCISRSLRKTEAQLYLKSLLIHLLFPPKQDTETAAKTCRATQPLNATNFFRTVEHLILSHQTSWPAHWATDVLQGVLSRHCVDTQLLLPPKEQPPTPPKTLPAGKTSKVDLRAFDAEIRTLCAVFRDTWVCRFGDRAPSPYADLTGNILSLSEVGKYRLDRLSLFPIRLRQLGMPKNNSVGLAIVRTRPGRGSFDSENSFAAFTMGGSCPIDVCEFLNAGKVLHLITTLDFCSRRKSCQFLLPRQVFEDLKGKKDVCAVLVDFTVYLSLSEPKSVGDAAFVEGLALQEFEG